MDHLVRVGVRVRAGVRVRVRVRVRLRVRVRVRDRDRLRVSTPCLWQYMVAESAFSMSVAAARSP